MPNFAAASMGESPKASPAIKRDMVNPMHARQLGFYRQPDKRSDHHLFANDQPYNHPKAYRVAQHGSKITP